MAQKGSTIDPKQPRKRKRTEKGRDWDETVEKELLPPKQTIVNVPSAAEPPSRSDFQTPSPKEIVVEKPRKTAPKKTAVDKAPTKKKPPANKKTDGDKSGEMRSKAKEKQAKQSAEVESRKSLAAQFFKAVSPSENLDDLTNEDNGHENGLMTAEHDVTYIAPKLPRLNAKRDQSRQSTPETNSCGVTDTVQRYRSDQLRNDIVASQQNVGLTTSPDTQLDNHFTGNAYMASPLHNNSNLANRQAFNRQTIEQQHIPDSETMTLGPSYSQVHFTRRQLQYLSPVSQFPDINDATMQTGPSANRFMAEGQFKPKKDIISAGRMKSSASEDQNSKPTPVHQPPSEDFGGLIRSSMSLANGDVDDDIYMDCLDESPALVTSNTPRCDNCEMLKKEIQYLKTNQMPGTSFFLLQLLPQMFWWLATPQNCITL